MKSALPNMTDLSNDRLTFSASSAHERRIKRMIVGRDQVFFAVTTPGFETLCRDELKGIGLPEAAMRVMPGGVEFSGRLTEGYRANLYSRLATRVLMRVVEFKATGFAEFEKKFAGVPWELYFQPEVSIGISLSVRKSRLTHSEAIAERIGKHLSARLRAQRAALADADQRLFIRGVSDRFSVSIDSSGAALYKRGIKTQGGRAPLRETGAAAILKIAGFVSGMPLVDPMSGAGTFSIEAAMMARNLPAGWFRDFAFMTWPSFRSRQWAHLRETAKKAIVSVPRPHIFAADRDPEACRALFERLQHHGLSEAVNVECRDFIDLRRPAVSPGDQGLIVLNPPFGKRLGTVSQSIALISTVCERMKTAFSGWRFALLVPPPAEMVPKRFLPCESRPFHHGGLMLTLLTGVIP